MKRAGYPRCSGISQTPQAAAFLAFQLVPSETHPSIVYLPDGAPFG